MYYQILRLEHIDIINRTLTNKNYHIDTSVWMLQICLFTR